MSDFSDDVAIDDDDYIWRAVTPKHVTWPGEGESDERPRIGSNFFQDYPEGKALALGLPGPCMSVGVERLLPSQGRVEAFLETDFSLDYGIVRVRVGDLRELVKETGEPCPQGVMSDPREDAPWHAVVWSKKGGKRSSGEQKAIRNKAQWVRLPPSRPQSAQ